MPEAIKMDQPPTGTDPIFTTFESVHGYTIVVAFTILVIFTPPNASVMLVQAILICLLFIAGQLPRAIFMRVNQAPIEAGRHKHE